MRYDHTNLDLHVPTWMQKAFIGPQWLEINDKNKSPISVYKLVFTD